jgi:ribose 1,5-bisphosphate isomerase
MSVETGFGATESALNLLGNIRKRIQEAGDWRELFGTLVREGESALEKRPTSALLFNTLRDILLKTKDLYESGESIRDAVDSIKDYITGLEKETVSSVEKLGVIGARRLPEDSVVLVHSYSTSVLKILENGYRQGKVREVFATESRPGGEGIFMAKLLSERGIRTNIIVDSAANYFMNKIDMVIFGAEAITANGALVNKIGTSLIALAAYHKRTRVLVASGTYKFSFETILGERIRIPKAPVDLVSPPKEILSNKNIILDLPLMDVTPSQYIDAIVTELGVTSPQSVPLILWEKHGKWPIGQPDTYTLLREMKKVASQIS